MVGDILIIPRHGCTLQCDAVLLNGTVIVNESMLTGESVPITKVIYFVIFIYLIKMNLIKINLIKINIFQVALTGIDEDNEAGEVRFNFDKHSKHVLYCGTAILQTRFYGGQYVKVWLLRSTV